MRCALPLPYKDKEVPLLVDRPLSQAPSPAHWTGLDALPNLTALSGVPRRPSSPEGRFPGLSALARRSLEGLLLVVLAPGCLVTAEPVTYEPEQTPPILVASGLDPDPRDILVFSGDVTGGVTIPISASVVSEDAGESVKMAIYLDYGQKNALGQPFRFTLSTFAELPPATLIDGARPLTGLLWNSNIYPVEPGCHRLTLVVTHAFDTASGCPKDLNDSSQVTWQYRQCAVGAGECPPLLEDCPSTEATCPLDPSAVANTDAGTTGG